MIWPPDYHAEYDRRRALINYLQATPAAREAVMHAYRHSITAWINDWGITYDPRKPGANKIIPFVLFPKQVEFLSFIRHLLNSKQSGLVEKSRDMGATWLCCAISCWLWLFHPGSSIGWGSRDQDTVDQKGNPDSIFEKIRMQLDALPEWMLPRGYNPRLNSKFMNIVNPENRSSIKGDAGENIGRGGRSLIYFKDESAHYEHAESIEAALGDNTDVQVDISSVNGTNNVFYSRRMAGQIWTPGAQIAAGVVRVFVMDWRDHPGKNQAWYDARHRKYAAEGLLHLLAQEVDRNYAAAVRGIIIPADHVTAAIDAHKKLGFGMDGERISALDVAGGDSDDGSEGQGPDKHADSIRQGVVLRHVSCWGEGDAGQAFQRAYTTAQQYGVTEMDYDCIGLGAGVKVEHRKSVEAGAVPASFRVIPWNAAHSPENADQRLIPGDINSPLIGDFFLNRKAQGWMNLAWRFEKTFKAVHKGEKFNPAELISLDSSMPHLHAAARELSQPTWAKDGKGKLKVNKRPDGAPSPNMGDAIMMDFNPARDYTEGFGYLEFMGRMVEKDKTDKEKNAIVNTRV